MLEESSCSSDRSQPSPVSGQTEQTGTLADFLRELGVEVTEVDLDEDDDEDDDDEREGCAYVDDEAEEDEAMPDE
jgi:hypothetical protein